MKKFFIVCGLLLYLGSSLLAQQIQVTGTVTDAGDGSTLPGVTVAVKGTTQGTVTDMDGRYEISAASDAILVYSFIGMATREVPVEGRTVIDVALSSDMIGLEEVIVVGYGVQRREATAGSVAVVGENDLRNTPVTSPEKLLQGKVAGLQLNTTSGQPGASSQIR
ncbi:MAG: carboxypeptidase-like regulatory domain-containing protein, partial [Bacteroidota bacterium]